MKKVLYILGEFEDDDADWLAAAGESRALTSGHVLIQEGEPIDSVFIVTQGTFAVTTGSAAREVARVGAGEVLGEVSYIDRRPPTATVTAVEESRVLALPRSVLTARIGDDPAFAARFYRAVALFLADRLRATLRQVAGEAADGPGADDELDLEALESVSRAGVRFERILQRLQSV